MTTDITRKTRSQARYVSLGLENKKRISKVSKNKNNRINLFRKTNNKNLNLNMSVEIDEILNAMSVDELKLEVKRLMDLNECQNNQLTLLRNEIKALPKEKPENQLIQSLIDSFRCFNIDIQPPKCDENMNSNHFLDKFEKFCVLKHIVENRLSVLDGTFNRRAKAWIDSKRESFVNYRDFKQKFLLEFYSIPVRVCSE